MLEVVNADACKETQTLAERYRNATPFPHLVIDNFLHKDLAEMLLTDFPDISLMHQSHHYLFNQKYELSFWAKASQLFSQLHQDLLSDEFRSFMCQVSDDDVFMDFDFCGELHQGTNGSFLDMHVDFNLHPKHDHWVHKLTLLIYLNKNWQDAYGGQLLLQETETSKIYEIAPSFNRCVIVKSDESTYHGYRQLNLPEGITRKSILVNFYQQVAPDQIPPRRPTKWATSNVSPLKSGLARLYNPISTLKHRLFGLTPAGDREEVAKINDRKSTIAKK
jgi:Rps23 Pro-64 3,4-dihydroxylase Tpa1-like proline 4-hydroxylase